MSFVDPKVLLSAHLRAEDGGLADLNVLANQFRVRYCLLISLNK